MSAYRKTVICMLCEIMILLVAIAWRVGVFQSIATMPFLSTINTVCSNAWFSSICSSIIAVFLIYKWQVWYSKRKIKEDLRCNDIIRSVYDGTKEFAKFSEKFPSKEIADENEDYHITRKKNALLHVEFFKNNKGAIFVTNLSLTYEGVDLLLDSIQSCFLINLNFELLGILNHVKTSLLSLREKYPKIKEIFEIYENAPNDDDLIKLGELIYTYFIDLKFMVGYWKDILNYLEYDPSFIELFIDTYNSKYSIVKDMQMPIEMQNSRAAEVEKIVRKTIRINRWKHFWTQ